MQRLTCNLCPLLCCMSDGERGDCKARGNVGGEIKLLTYGMVTTAIVGHVEHKPFYHFEPGMKILSIGGMGCNMRCGFCQNFEISQDSSQPYTQMSPSQVVDMAIENGARGIAFTYNEPIIWFEYVMDVCQEAKKSGLRTLLKTNGYVDLSKFSEIASQMSAINIDIKGDSIDYKRTCLVSGAAEDVVLKNLAMACLQCHCEVSLILTPPVSMERTRRILVRARLFCGHQTAFHLLRFIPDFKMKDVPATPVGDMKAVHEMALEFFGYPYLHGMGSQDTKCTNCGDVVVKRRGSKVIESKMGEPAEDGYYSCATCRTVLPIRSCKDEI